MDAPANPNVAPPGRYMLFLIDDKGVPSVASLLQVQNGTADTQPPTQPGGPTASVSGRRRDALVERRDATTAG